MHDLLFRLDWVPALRTDMLTVFFRAVTELGSNWVAVGFLALGLLLGRRSTFARLVIVCAVSEILNTHLKSAYMAPRPDPAYSVVDVTGWSFPSGHAQHGTVMWLWLAWETGKPGAWAACTLLAISIALSRVYLGVHFGRDIIAGSILGLTMLAYFLWLFDRRRWNLNRHKAYVASGFIIGIQCVWAALTPAGARIYMFLPSIIYICFLLGVALGQKRGSSCPKSRFLWGVLTTVVVFGVGLFTELRAGSSWIGPLGLGTHPVSVHVQFTLLGMWMGLVAPNIFKRLELSVRPS